MASAAPAAPSAVSFDGPDGHGDGNGGGHGRGGRPIRFGPFEFPANGNISGGFAWDTSNGGGIGF
ncbi:hypothetical protein ACF08N_16240 [Streptomyces sp. NPDC015127]|uniref:hypothetical protein n=1 Tax=Streptomyces sp. NPDC015127 TaxID=3364939 RepID=UPI0036F9034A